MNITQKENTLLGIEHSKSVLKIEIVDKQQAEVDIINSIQKLYKEQRQSSKAP